MATQFQIIRANQKHLMWRQAQIGITTKDEMISFAAQELGVDSRGLKISKVTKEYAKSLIGTKSSSTDMGINFDVSAPFFLVQPNISYDFEEKQKELVNQIERVLPDNKKTLSNQIASFISPEGNEKDFAKKLCKLGLKKYIGRLKNISRSYLNQSRPTQQKQAQRTGVHKTGKDLPLVHCKRRKLANTLKATIIQQLQIPGVTENNIEAIRNGSLATITIQELRNAIYELDTLFSNTTVIEVKKSNITVDVYDFNYGAFVKNRPGPGSRVRAAFMFAIESHNDNKSQELGDSISTDIIKTTWSFTKYFNQFRAMPALNYITGGQFATSITSANPVILSGASPTNTDFKKKLGQDRARQLVMYNLAHAAQNPESHIIMLTTSNETSRYNNDVAAALLLGVPANEIGSNPQVKSFSDDDGKSLQEIIDESMALMQMSADLAVSKYRCKAEVVHWGELLYTMGERGDRSFTLSSETPLRYTNPGLHRSVSRHGICPDPQEVEIEYDSGSVGGSQRFLQGGAYLHNFDLLWRKYNNNADRSFKISVNQGSLAMLSNWIKSKHDTYPNKNKILSQLGKAIEALSKEKNNDTISYDKRDALNYLQPYFDHAATYALKELAVFSTLREAYEQLHFVYPFRNSPEDDNFQGIEELGIKFYRIAWTGHPQYTHIQEAKHYVPCPVGKPELSHKTPPELIFQILSDEVKFAERKRQ